jgi:late competence protein required for DNA uptake (superfamily II DNA/RNA helicase)
MIVDDINKICYMCNCGLKYKQQNIVKINGDLFYVKKPEKYNCNRCNTMLTKQCIGYDELVTSSFGTHAYWCSKCFNFIRENDMTKCHGAIYYKIHKFMVFIQISNPIFI